MITQRDINAAQHIIFDSGVADKFEAALRGSHTGRPATFRHSLFLAGMYLAVHQYKHAHITVIHKTLTEDLPLETQFAWGVRQHRTTATGSEIWVLSIDDLENVSSRVLNRMNYSEARLPDQEEPGDMAAERAARYAALTDIIDTMLRSTLIPRPEGASDYALDGTGIWANERAWRALPEKAAIVETEERLAPVDPAGVDFDEDAPTEEEVQHVIDADSEFDAAPAARKRRPRRARKGGPTDAAFGGKTGKDGKKEVFFGYEMHAIVRAPLANPAGTKRFEPALAECVRFTPAGRDIVDASLEAIDAVLATGQRIDYLMTDRHYSHKRWSRWAKELLKRNIAQVVDMREDNHGFKDWDGMLVADGQFFCPATPREYGVIPKPDNKASKARWDEFHRLIAERDAYAAGITKPMDEDGHERVGCPAICGKIGCANREGTVQAAVLLGLPIVANPPVGEAAPLICRRNSVAVNIETPAQEAVMKVHQKLPWGTLKWLLKFARRTFVEGWFGILKGDTAAAKKRGSSMYVGLAHTTLELTIFAAIANVMAMRRWHAETGLGDASNPLLAEPEPTFGYQLLSKEDYERFAATQQPKAA